MSTYMDQSSFDTPAKKTKRDADVRMKHAEETRRIREEHAVQRNLLIYIINQHCDMVIAKPFKKCKLTNQIYFVNSITINNEYFDIESFIDQRCSEYYNQDILSGLSPTKARRRSLNRKHMALNNLLVDICFEFGYFFNYKNLSRINRNEITLINGVFYKNNMIISESDIGRISSRITSLFDSKDKVIDLKMNELAF